MHEVTALPATSATPSTPATMTTELSPTWRLRLGAYVSLMKPHVTVLLLGTTLASMVVAANGMPPFGLIVATLLGGALAAGSANAINCYWDRDIDSLMTRTRTRACNRERRREPDET